MRAPARAVARGDRQGDVDLAGQAFGAIVQGRPAIQLVGHAALDQVDPETLDLKKQIAAHARRRPAEPPTKAAILVEENRETHIHVRGDFLRKGDGVEPATLAVLHPLRAPQ